MWQGLLIVMNMHISTNEFPSVLWTFVVFFSCFCSPRLNSFASFSLLSSVLCLTSTGSCLVKKHLKSQIFLSGVGGDQKTAWRRVNIGFTFTRWPETKLQMNTICQMCKLSVASPARAMANFQTDGSWRLYCQCKHCLTHEHFLRFIHILCSLK